MVLVQTTLDGQANPKIHLALQKNYGEKGKRYERTFAIQQCGGEPFEIALRFAGCCLKCGACFASGYAWVDRFLSNPRVICVSSPDDVIPDYERIQYPHNYPGYNWLRILGGEPLLNDDYIKFLFDTIITISKIESQKFNKGVVIQTNGIFVGQGNVDLLRTKLEELLRFSPEVKVCIEVSIKGTNLEEFELITRSTNRPISELSDFEKLFGWSLKAQSSEELFGFNIGAFYKLRDLALDLPNFRPTVIAGFGVNESYLLGEGQSNERITIVFKDNKPIYHPDFWSKDFRELYKDYTRYAVETFGPRFVNMPMYGIKDLFEYPWVPRALKQGRRIYGDRWYDAKFAHERGGRNARLEQAFAGILSKFFFVDNRTYYSALIKWKR